MSTQITTAINSINKLPVMALANDVIHALLESDVLLHAEPGAGKSTALPIAILLSGFFNGKIILLEPRRLAARLVATRLASHLGEKPGQRVGLRMRSDTRCLLYTSPSPRDRQKSRMPSSA